MLVLQGLRQEDHQEFETSLGYIINVGPSEAIVVRCFCFKKKKRKKIKPGTVAAIRRLNPKDYNEFKSSLGYRVNSRLA